MDEVRKYAIANFNPLPPCGGRLLTAPPVLRRECYFNPLPPCGGRRRAYALRSKQRHFNPLPPCGGRRDCAPEDIDRHYISIHSLRVEGDFAGCNHIAYGNCISIHSLRVEGDPAHHRRQPKPRYFNPLPPCGGRLGAVVDAVPKLLFQSTPSVWRETRTNCGILRQKAYFNPLPPCGGRPCSRLSGKTARPISIHSLRVEGDGSAKRTPERSHTRFQSTPSVWRETTHGSGYQTPCAISIHSLRVEGDSITHHHPHLHHNFNPLPPCGGRHLCSIIDIVRRSISIHSLRVEGDKMPPAQCRHRRHFNPLPPCGGRRTQQRDRRRRCVISIHSLRVEGDYSMPRLVCQDKISIHSLRVEGD